MSRAREVGDLGSVATVSSGNVGIGTSSPSTELDVAGDATIGTDTGGILNVKGGSTTSPQIRFFDGGTGRARIGVPTGQTYLSLSGSDTLTADAVIDSSGNLLVGKTAFSSTTEGAELRATGQAILVADGTNPILMNRQTSDGDIAVFRKDGTTVGSIGSLSGVVSYIVLDPRGSGSGLRGSTASILATDNTGANNDNALDLGSGTTRFDDIYATNGTIQTSDRNEKQDIEELSDAEQRVAVAAKGLLRKYRWKDAVAEKGDEARIHFGIIAQDLQAAFAAEGLDAGRYGMFISSTWWEADRVIPAVEAQDAVYETQVDEDGNEVQVLVSEAVEAQPERVVTDTFETLEEAPEGAVQRTRLGVRYPELLAFIIAAL